MKRLVIGILAHVDSGKTTLSEAMLYLSGKIKKLGRVDHGSAFLDTHSLERERGITIFSKQAVLPLESAEITLLDTPGHVDFSSEMERTLQVLDYAVLVISGTDGVQSHTETLWRLLRNHHIPTLLFINKMDLAGAQRGALMDGLKSHLSGNCVDFSGEAPPETFYESVAMCDEELLDQFLDAGRLDEAAVCAAIARQKVFPCFFGSALKLLGVDAFLKGLETYTRAPAPRDAFGARVFKISRDGQGSRLTHLKITGGILRVKDTLSYHAGETDGWSEKADQIRIYSGAKFQAAEQAPQGTVCAVTGLSHTFPGQGIGAEPQPDSPAIEPVLIYRVELPAGLDAHTALSKLRLLEEEDPQLHVDWNERFQEIRVQLMGEIQLEVLKSLMAQRFGMDIRFGPGNIVYQETIAEPVEGVGHFEPLRHYAEVHLLLEPLPRGSGMHFGTACSEDELDRNWQRLILTHLQEKAHAGVLTGSPITDIKITLLTGRAHPKHTEGGDFRQATYRAVRQGLRQARSILLEPWYAFTMQLPPEMVGRAMADLQRMAGRFDPPRPQGALTVLSGCVPAAEMREYQLEFTSFTHGRGRLSYSLQGYEPCHNAGEAIAALGYDCDKDTDNPADSIFCAHGAGFTVKWDQVRAHMHVDSGYRPAGIPDGTPDEAGGSLPRPAQQRAADYCAALEQDKELMAIFERTYGPIRRDPRAALRTPQDTLRTPRDTLRTPRDTLRTPRDALRTQRDTRKARAGQGEAPARTGGSAAKPSGPEYLLVDGYNIIFAWDDLKALARESLDTARSRLMHILCNFQGYRQCELILVFDAYKVPGNTREVERFHNISVVYTKEAETADMYIEKATRALSGKARVRVATSDGLEQIIILSHGALRVSARALREEVAEAEKAIRSYLEQPFAP